jgi:hypothetical protein
MRFAAGTKSFLDLALARASAGRLIFAILFA